MTDGGWWEGQGRCEVARRQVQAGSSRWLDSSAAKKVFSKDWLPTLLGTFAELQGNKYRLLAGNVALETGGCGDIASAAIHATAVSGTKRCVACGQDRVRVLDPDTDEVFQTRKGYYRASAVRALKAA